MFNLDYDFGFSFTSLLFFGEPKFPELKCRTKR